jgi:apolipoprotein N-acyltransferase
MPLDMAGRTGYHIPMKQGTDNTQRANRLRRLFPNLGPSHIGLAALSGVVFLLSFPGFNVWPLAWVALVPLLAALRGKTLREAFTLGLIAGTLHSVGMISILPWTIANLGRPFAAGILALVIVATCTGCFIAVWAAAAAFCMKRALRPERPSVWIPLLFLPALWVTLEFIQRYLAVGMPWTFFFCGYTPWKVPHLIQIADLVGAHGVAFLIVFFNSALYLGISGKRYRVLGTAATVLALCVGYGFWRITSLDTPGPDRRVKVAVLQGNVNIQEKLDPKKGDLLAKQYLDLNRRAAQVRPDLIVWTETAIPWPLEPGDDLLEESLRITHDTGASHLVGTPSPSDVQGFYYNTAFFVRPDGNAVAAYRKVRLLAYTERSPFHLRRPVKPAPGRRELPYVAAEEPEMLDTPLGRIGVTICSENLFPDLPRKQVVAGAEYLVNMSNDMWTPSKTLLESHFSMNVLRSIENRRDSVVASNMGVSGIVHADGRIQVLGNPTTPACYTGEVFRRGGRTIYNRTGDLFCILCAAASILLTVLPARRPS